MKKVVVLMSTYNGEKYLRTQIDSLLKQEDVEVEILARDDGSTDRTLQILESYRKCSEHSAENKVTDVAENIVTDGIENMVTNGADNNTGNVYAGCTGNDSKIADLGNDRNHRGSRISFSYYIGENVGPAGSFLDLMKHAPVADYYALCDQDDTWLPDKLKIAIDAIKQRIADTESYETKIISELSEEGETASADEKKNRESAERVVAANVRREVPVLYYGMPRFADNDGNLLTGPKGIYEKSLDFPACLIKSNSTGCTMVFNKKLLDIINSKTPGAITMHDEWLHKVCLALNGEVIYDEDVHILYRQHGNNTIGGQLSLSKVMKRYWKTVTEPDCIRSKCIKSLVDCYGDEMCPKSYEMAEKVASYKKSFKDRMKLLLDRNIKMEYLKRNIMFKMAVLLGIF